MRDLRNHTTSVLRRVERGERLRVTVNGRPVAQIAPLARRREAVPWAEVAQALETCRADTELLTDWYKLMVERPVPAESHPIRATRAALNELTRWGAQLVLIKGDLTDRGRTGRLIALRRLARIGWFARACGRPP